MRLKIIPTGNFVFFRKVKSEESWCKQSGIKLYDKSKAKDEETDSSRAQALSDSRLIVEAEVVTVGPGRSDDKGILHELRVKVCDRVLLSRWVGSRREIIIGDQAYALTDSYLIMATLEEKNNEDQTAK